MAKKMKSMTTKIFEKALEEYFALNDTDCQNDDDPIKSFQYLSNFIDENFKILNEEQIRRIADIDSLNSVLINDSLIYCLNCPADLKAELEEWLKDYYDM